MRALIQRVREASVTVNSVVTGQIGLGILVFLGVAPDDDAHDLDYIVKKCATLRIFDDSQGRMNLGPTEVQAEFLVVSQFTLFADCNQGRRPYYGDAAEPELAVLLYEQFAAALKSAGFTTQTGVFGAMMDVTLVNNGPVTIMLDSKGPKPPL